MLTSHSTPLCLRPKTLGGRRVGIWELKPMSDLHMKSGFTVYCLCDRRQVILSLCALVSSSIKQDGSSSAGSGCWMEQRCQVSPRCQQQAPERHVMTSGRAGEKVLSTSQLRWVDVAAGNIVSNFSGPNLGSWERAL